MIGVVKDFHFKSLRTAIEPLAFYSAPRGSMLSVRFQANDVSGALKHLEATWEKFDSVYPFAYSFLDEQFDTFYSSERSLMQLLAIFAGIAIIIACLGLFGLASFLTEQRTKETGIRKVLGASLVQIVLLFVLDFSRLLLAAFVVAMPVAYFLAESWLGDFAYRTTPDVELFLLAGSIVSVIALLSVSYQPIRAALSDPVEALRYE